VPASATDTLAINPIIYSELSIGFARIEELEAVIKEASLAIEDMPREPCFSQARHFSDIGAVVEQNAACCEIFTSARIEAVMQWPLLTRDVGRYRAFPPVSLIAP